MAFNYLALGGFIWLIILVVVVLLFLFMGSILLGGLFFIIKSILGLVSFIFSLISFKKGTAKVGKMMNSVDNTSNKLGRKFK